MFYDERCVRFHHAHQICQTLIRCPLCCKEIVTSELKEPHRCHYGKCHVCHEKLHLLKHQCFIQQIDPKDDGKKKKSKKQLLKHLKIKPSASVYVEPPVSVYADFEAMPSRPIRPSFPSSGMCSHLSLGDFLSFLQLWMHSWVLSVSHWLGRKRIWRGT